MDLNVRIMSMEETDIITDYFNDSSPEHLKLLGINPTRLPHKNASKKFFESEYEKKIEDRQFFAVIWEVNDKLIGFSSLDKITFGLVANMHLHIIDEELRQKGIGVACVRESAKIYFSILKLKQLYCEPNAFNVAPNRTLQKAGFKYVKTYRTVPGPMNYHQAVNKWVMVNTP